MNRVYLVYWIVLPNVEPPPLSSPYDGSNRCWHPAEVNVVAVATDGTNRLALVVATDRVVEGFVEPLADSSLAWMTEPSPSSPWLNAHLKGVAL